MRYLIFVGLFALFCACKTDDKKAKSLIHEVNEIKVPTRLDSLEKLVLVMEKKEPIKTIPFYTEISNIYAKNKNRPKQAYAHFSLANIYDKHISNFKKASHHGHMALGLWELEKDTLQMANLFNYCGYLSAKEGNVEFGKLQLNKAEQLFIGLNDSKGKANTYYRMAQVHFLDNDFKRSEKFYKLAKKYWTENYNNERLLELNVFGIELYTKMGKKAILKELAIENAKLK